jgi:hypothetical protein
MYFAERNSPDRPLLSKEQAAYRLDEFLLPCSSLGPGQARIRPHVGQGALRQVRQVPGLRRKQPARDPAWAATLERQADLRTFPASAAGPSPWPTPPAQHAHHRGPLQRPDLPGEGYPFDYLQHSSVPLGTPLSISHATRDGTWILVESPFTFGWIPASDAAQVDEAFIRDYQTRPNAANIRANVPFARGQALDIGCVLPCPDSPGAGWP